MHDRAPDSEKQPRPWDANQGVRPEGDAEPTHGELLLAITELIAGGDALPDLFARIAPLLGQLADCDFVNLSLYEPAQKSVLIRLWAKQPGTVQQKKFPAAERACAWVWQHQKPLVIRDLVSETRFAETVSTLVTLGVRSLAVFPLSTARSRYGALGFSTRTRRWEGEQDTGLLSRVAQLVALAVETRELRLGLHEPAGGRHQEGMESELRAQEYLEGIVGESPALKHVLEYAAVVARTDTTVLLTGETGTGKERVAHAIHLMSPRRDHPFIKLNCAAIPTGLLESELFGHEKGAFTGAISQKIGRLELADKGTLLLDEIGEIPLELQPKLLRILQDHEFERLGGLKTIRVDVRLIAASNRDLVQAVEEKLFRSDLFYRLHVFPLHVPALRERREDIPLLIRHFVEKCAARLHKRIDRIPDGAVEVMMNYEWPGNIREMENFIERAVILSDGNRLSPPLNELHGSARQLTEGEGTLRDRERDHIVTILRQTRGLISGPSGAAVRLGLKRTTLQYKIQKLGISRHEYLD